jgi:hypothetical protein
MWLLQGPVEGVPPMWSVRSRWSRPPAAQRPSHRHGRWWSHHQYCQYCPNSEVTSMHHKQNISTNEIIYSRLGTYCIHSQTANPWTTWPDDAPKNFSGSFYVLPVPYRYILKITNIPHLTWRTTGIFFNANEPFKTVAGGERKLNN